MIKKALVGVLSLLPIVHSCQQSHNTEVEIAVCCINDFHAAFVADENRELYGVGSLLTALDSIKSVYPHHIVVSAGDNFGGSYFHKVTNGVAMPQFFKECGIQVSAIGNHEFDEGQQKLAAKWSELCNDKNPYDLIYLSANLRDSLGKTPYYAKAYTTKEIKLSDNKSFTLSLIGLTTASTPQQTNARLIQGLHFDPNYLAVIDSVKSTPDYQSVSSKIDACVLVGHLGARRNNGNPKWEDISALQLAPIDRTIADAFFAAHTHDTLSAFINNKQLPIVQAGSNGAYIGCFKIKFDTLKNIVTSITPEIYPIRKSTNYTSHVAQLVDSLLSITCVEGRPLNEKLCTIESEMPHDRLQRYAFSEVADIVCNSYAAAFIQYNPTNKIPVIGISHYGSIRAGLYPGVLSVLNAGEILPFANNLRAYRYKGKDLKKLATFGLHNSKYGWLQSNALTFECVSATDLVVNKVYYTDTSGATTEIKDNDTCIIVVDDYMVTGGDGYLPEFFQKDMEIKTVLPTTTAAFLNYLKSQTIIKSNPNMMKKLRIEGNTYSSLYEIKQ